VRQAKDRTLNKVGSLKGSRVGREMCRREEVRLRYLFAGTPICIAARDFARANLDIMIDEWSIDRAAFS
jgi:hypothetical protein